MAATGGGKIRSRRYHIASKPYAKSKQQSGIISRVTDTVKSIVPSWLQKYFKNGDAPEREDLSLGIDQNCQSRPNGSEEEPPPPIDGRDSPEPGTSNTEPSTSRASLNFQEYVLSRPPLTRSHLHFTPLDVSSPSLGASSSPFSQPSTSSAPGPFTTGFSLVKEIKDNLSQHEDDNISTTSGFSSRASDKDIPTSKTASIHQLWSPEVDRTHSGPQPSQTTLKKPSFNLSVFGTSNSTFNSSLLSSSQFGDSPFYPGKTTYGGASAVKSTRGRPGTPYQAPVRRQIKAKPAGAQPCGVTSATARRILQSLERMSSPLADARRIPSASLPISPPSAELMNLEASHHQAKKKRMDSTLPPVQKLVVPAAASVSGSRSVSFRPTLTPGGATRPLDRTTRENTPSRQSPKLPEVIAGLSESTRSSGPTYPLSSTPASSNVNSGGGKIKRERTSARPSSKRCEENEVIEVPDIPRISLPISASSLPTFSFTSQLPPTTTSVSPTIQIPAVTPIKESDTNKDPPKASTPPCIPFTFSSPIVKATAASPPSFSSSPGFTFSAPVAKLGSSISNGKLSTPIAVSVKPVTNKSTEEFDGPFKPAKTLQQGSVLGLLKSPDFWSTDAQTSSCPATTAQQASTVSPSVPTSTVSSTTRLGDFFKPTTDWSCEVCLVQNKQSAAACVCCSASKPNSSKSLDNQTPRTASAALPSCSTSTPSSSSTTSFSTIFSKPEGTWDCDTCLVRNKASAAKCVACETARAGIGLKTTLTFSPTFSAVKTAPATTEFTGFAEKLKPEGAWECETCLVQNKAEDAKCVACTAAKPGPKPEAASSSGNPQTFGLAEKFKPPEGSWECDVCLVQNKAADVQCVACQTAKPGATVEPKGFGSFGSSPAVTTAASASGPSTSTFGGFKFGTTDKTTGSTGFKFGTASSDSSTSSSSSSGGFTFGVTVGKSSTESSSTDSTESTGFKFGSSSGAFKFGVVSGDKKADKPAAGADFKFGVNNEIKFGSAGTENNLPKVSFAFGQAKPEEKTVEAASTSFAASFVPPPTQEKSDKESSGVALSVPAPAPRGSVFDRLGEPSPPSSTQESSMFKPLQTAKESAVPTFTFLKSEEKKEKAASPVPSAFVFGAASKEGESVGFSFGKAGSTAEPPAAPFSFGKPAEKNETKALEVPKPTFNFGQNAADTSAAPKQTFSFMVKNSAAATNSTTLSSSTPAPPLFGDSSSSTAAAASATSTFVFGQNSTSSGEAPAKTFVFGQTQDSQPRAPSNAPLNAPPTQNQPFIFGASTQSAAAAPAFSFGAAAPSAASSSAPPAPASSSPFVFNSSSAGGFGANQTPAFGSSFGSPFTAAPTQAPSFGAKANAAPPIFGQQTNSTPVFGAAANPAPSGGFQFGATNTFGGSNNAAPGVFTFGAGSTAPTSANPSIPPAGGGGFNFTQTPTFSIGSNKSFAASPAGQTSIPGRKIKTAVRRRK